ncbi:MAG: hypothetical protein BGO01_06855 [Armatimonadetes bacterium 55-13]|nr:hypothetical protein [Armatimonadota bacterium]OJU62219.1 MAG: hypothetical protein BGO01_06855 [Armatimonadetes bacterium 55-13]
MWQRFSENARKVVFQAQLEAEKFQSGAVDAEHLLLGILATPECRAAKYLEDCPSLAVDIKARLEGTLSKTWTPSQETTLTPRAKKIIDYAYEEARNLRHIYIGSEHLLLALLRDDSGTSGDALRAAGITLGAARLGLEAPDQRESVTSPSHSQLVNQTQFYFQYLKPVDQVIMAILSDGESSAGRRLRQACSSLEWIMPSIAATMMESRDAVKGGWSEIRQLVPVKALKENGTEALYRAAISLTSAETLAVLKGLDLILPLES